MVYFLPHFTSIFNGSHKVEDDIVSEVRSTFGLELNCIEL